MSSKRALRTNLPEIISFYNFFKLVKIFVVAIFECENVKLVSFDFDFFFTPFCVLNFCMSFRAYNLRSIRIS